MIIIAASTKDIASMNIAHQIIGHYKFERLPDTFHENSVYLKRVQNREVRLVFVNVEPIYTQFITNHFTPELLVFISRHSSRSGIPTLSTHTPGNLDRADLGGIPKKVSISPASAMRDALLEMTKLKEKMELNYQVSYECTHHGPCLDVPTMFVELGSSPKQWKDIKAAEIVAHAALVAVSKRSRYPTAMGIGGPHYNKKFTKIALGTRTAFGHMIPKYAISQIEAKMVEQCVDRTIETVESAFLDWKGIPSADKSRLTAILGEIGVSTEKV